jgi:hypothetical protein
MRLPGLALLLQVIRDLGQGRLPLGFATHRGMGAVGVERVEVTGRDLPEDLQALRQVNLSDGRLTDLPLDLRQALNQAWKQWFEGHHTEVTA